MRPKILCNLHVQNELLLACGRILEVTVAGASESVSRMLPWCFFGSLSYFPTSFYLPCDVLFYNQCAVPLSNALALDVYQSGSKRKTKPLYLKQRKFNARKWFQKWVRSGGDREGPVQHFGGRRGKAGSHRDPVGRPGSYLPLRLFLVSFCRLSLLVPLFFHLRLVLS